MSVKESKTLILIVNCGSSSLKLSLFESESNSACRRLVDQLYEAPYQADLPTILPDFLKKHGVATHNILAAGHRFVHGGPEQHQSVLLTPALLQDLISLKDLAPLHNPACLAGIENCQKWLPQHIPQAIVFDTAFYHSLPPKAALYALDYKLAERYHIRRYGFHGLSHAFLWQLYAANYPQNASRGKIITIHLGSGCSMTAIKRGIALDTSMGFTPAEGLIMGTRAGDIDAGVIEFLCRHKNLSPSEVMNLLNFESGLLGLSGLSSDMRVLLDQSSVNPRAQLAIDMFCYRILKYIGAYTAVLGGVDALIFSGGIGENAAPIRKQILSSLEWLGISLDNLVNQNTKGIKPGELIKISGNESKTSIYAAGTDENTYIAREVQKLIV